MHSEDDNALLLLYKNGREEEALRMLVQHYSSNLFRHISTLLSDRKDAEDVLQNTFIKAWKGLPNFRGDSKLSTWLYRIATNESLNVLRNQKKLITETWESLHDAIITNHNTAFELNSDELMNKFEQALDALPTRQKQVFSLRYFEELPYEEIAQITGLTTGALKASYFHAAEKIKKSMLHD